MSDVYGGVQLPKSKPIRMKIRKGQFVPNTSSFKPTLFYTNNTGLSQPPSLLRNMGSSTRKLGMTPMHIRARRSASRRSASRRSASRRSASRRSASRRSASRSSASRRSASRRSASRRSASRRRTYRKNRHSVA